MATMIQRATAIIEAASNSTASQAQLNRVADVFIRIRPDLYSPADPDNPTNEERATPFVLAVRANLRHQIKSAIERQARADNEAAVSAAGAAAEADIP